VCAVSPAAPNDEASWSNIPTDFLLAELRRRQQDAPPKPECGSRDRGWYDTAAHVFALFLILALSTACCGFPLLSRRTTTGPRRKSIIFYCQHVGTGVLLATAFVHLLPMAFESLTDPCLPYFFSEGYTPLPGFIAMVSAIMVVGVESYLTARGAGHSHSHAHHYWDGSEDGEETSQIPLQVTSHASATLASRRAASRPNRLDLDGATDGLVAGVSPLPESSPVLRANGTKKLGRGAGDDTDDGDSDLDLDMTELDPASMGSSLHLGSGSRAEPEEEPQTPRVASPEEQKRLMLQCLLLEAGILFHSVFIGMAISVSTGPAFVVFLIAISFHQSFEGLALGSRIAAINFPRKSFRPWLMVLAYGLTTPIGQAIGLIVHKLYDPQSMGGLLVVGFMNAISSGLLLYAGLVQLLAEDFLTEKSYKVLRGKKRLRAYLAVTVGALMMAIVGAFA
jgi:solute carrier family 39 (zinc transporter), member 1/2/3